MENELEYCFNVLGPGKICLQGIRIGIESILYEYLYHGNTSDCSSDP